MKLANGVKSVDIGNGEYLHFWYANNKGHGSNNCTIIRTKELRSNRSKTQDGVIATVKTSAWAGAVNFSESVQERLGLKG